MNIKGNDFSRIAYVGYIYTIPVLTSTTVTAQVVPDLAAIIEIILYWFIHGYQDTALPEL